ncbi:MAG: O-antigen ligase family protein [Candidatus Doudnabacteria bacterium]|nr:O-antigen ligase family protein [Candidatus Doudnabacteria bacterium]
MKQFIAKLRFSEIFLVSLLFLIPIQTRILYSPDKAYVSWYFNYHLAFFVYLSDLFLILCFTAYWIERRETNVSQTIKWLILAIILWASVSLLHVKHLDLGFYNLFKLVELLGLMVIIPSIIAKKGLFKVALWLILVAGVFQAVLGIWQFHVQHQLGLSWLGEYIAPLGTPGLATLDLFGQKIIRAYGTFPHPNVLGGFLLFPLSAGFFLVSHETNNKKRLILAIFLIIITFGIFFSFSRIAWIGAIMLYALALFYYIKNLMKPALISALLVLLISAMVMGLGYKSYIVSRATDVKDTRSINDRGLFNQFGIEAIKNSPFLGTGIGNYIPDLISRKSLEPWQYQPPHNVYLFQAAELGLVGLGLFLALVYQIFKNAWSRWPKNETYFFLSLVFVLLLIGLFDHYLITVQQGKLTLFTALGLLLGSAKLND